MYPVLFSIDFFGHLVNIHSYGVLISFGALMGFIYASTTAKKELGIESQTMQGLARIIIIAAFVGGKVLYFLEDPGFYFFPPANMLHNFRTGFVFYGSLLFVIPSVIWFFRKHKLPVMPMLDIVAIAGLIIHIFGRMGCFFAGCCYGKKTDGLIFIEFTDTASVAPLHQHLHPTQLYSVTLLITILIVLLMFKRHKRFEGQLFFIYIMLYAIGRGVIEIFRGDIRRGYIIDGILSHSQFISLILLGIILFFYVRFLKKSKAN
ncbi:prolipoprotein diacylglyceryl transferase family protein [Reichenbachiella sp. MALMAid0571]|uniref:prolipoprotein diacylglyceryl transferase n=1 Tax=Reichenbachiella sp. MALMAid0571 TaxID=3143939 RepID=UPI0032DF0670